MSKTYTVEKKNVILDDGRRGVQTVLVHDDGERELYEIVVNRSADGRRIRQVYSRRSDLQARVFDFGHIGCAWQIEDEP